MYVAHFEAASNFGEAQPWPACCTWPRPPSIVGDPTFFRAVRPAGLLANRPPSLLPTGHWDSVNGCTSGCIQRTRDKLGPAFSQNNSYTANVANSNYNAGQISVEHKTNNLSILAAYTFSKGIDNSSGFSQWVNFANYRLRRLAVKLALATIRQTHAR
jgi:hypothetical protein